MGILLLDSVALTKIQSIILIAIIAVATLVGGIAYVLLNGEKLDDTIKIGLLHDLDNTSGKNAIEGATLAAEQLNGAGGILGRKVVIIGEDNDKGNTDPADLSTAMNRLISFHNVDFIIGGAPNEALDLTVQEISATHKIIFLQTTGTVDVLGENVLNDYEKYKYWFTDYPNGTALTDMIDQSFLTLGDYTGFKNVGLLADDLSWTKDWRESLSQELAEEGFNLVYQGLVFPSEVDFTSYLSAMEEAKVEFLITLLATSNSISFIKQWNDIESPFLVWGVNIVGADSQYWDWTEGKCVTESIATSSFVAGYPMTEVTLPAREAFIERWGHIPTVDASAAYDAVRFILSDAIERAGTIETEAVIKALEETDIETSLAKRFVFTSSHDVMVGATGVNEIGDIFMVACKFQWQDGKQVPVYPKELMEEAGATYKFPDWPGPWDK